MVPQPFEVNLVADDDPYNILVGFQHKLRAHVRRIAPTEDNPRTMWSLRLFMTIWQTHRAENDTKGVASVYGFVWDKTATLLAVRNVYHLPFGDKPNVDDLIDHFSVPNDMADIWNAGLAMKHVSGADCTVLQNNVVTFGEKSGQYETIPEHAFINSGLKY
jgi:hypothetical protein